MPRVAQHNDFKPNRDDTRVVKAKPSHQDYARTIPCNDISVFAPFRWLKSAVSDLLHMPIISLFYGVCFMLAAVMIVKLIELQGAHSHLVIMPSLIVYMLIGPFLALGLYDASWARERQHSISLFHSMKAIGRNSSSQWAFAVLLMVAMIFWMRIAALLHALYPDVQGAGLSAFAPFLIAGSIVGFIIAAIIFSVSAFSIPLMMERQVDMMSAVFTSFNAVKNNIAAMAVWATLIGIGILIGFATYGVGMLITMPLLGYATWHGYRETIKRKH